MTMNITKADLILMRRAVNHYMAELEDSGRDTTEQYADLTRIYDELRRATARYTVKRHLNNPDESYMILAEVVEQDITREEAERKYEVESIDFKKFVIWVA